MCLQALVAAIIAAPGSLPRPPSAAVGGAGAADGRADSSHHKLPDR